jgi:hypothetical protein
LVGRACWKVLFCTVCRFVLMSPRYPSHPHLVYLSFIDDYHGKSLRLSFPHLWLLSDSLEIHSQAHRYDTRTTIFSPEGNHFKDRFRLVICLHLSSVTFPFNLGRLYQVEYALESINHAGTCIGILSKEGIVLAAEKRTPSKLLDVSTTAEKVFKIGRYETNPDVFYTHDFTSTKSSCLDCLQPYRLCRCWDYC